MEIFLARTQGFCAGVASAVEIVEKALEKYGSPLYVYHEIVHTTYVVADFKKRGVVFVEDIDDVPSNARIIFSAHGIPPNVIAGAKALEKGECAFTYFLGASILDNPSRPLAVAPMIPGTDRFDPKPFEGKAVILRIDNSVTSLRIDKMGHVNYGGGNLMDPSNLIWDGHPPVIAWPER